MDKRGMILLFAGLLLGGTGVYLVTAPSDPAPVRVAEAKVEPAADPVAEPVEEAKPAEPAPPVVQEPAPATPAKSSWKPADKAPSPKAVRARPAASKPASTQPSFSTDSKPAEAPIRADSKPAETVRPPETATPLEAAKNEAPKPEGPPMPARIPLRGEDIAPVAPPPKPEPKTVTLAAGTLLTVRVSDSLSSEQSLGGDSFQGVLDAPLVIDGFVIAERGARVEGKVVEAWPAGRVKGKARLTVQLTRVRTADGQNIPVETATFVKEGESSVKSDAVKVGVGSAIGAAIGAIAGGGKGAAIGAGAGAAAGTGAVLMTRGKAATIPAETRLSFKVEKSVPITEKLRN